MNKKNVREKTDQSLEETAPVSSTPLRRKRGRPRKNPLPEALSPEAPVATEPVVTAEPGPDATAAEPPRRKRGRPRKHPMPEAPAPEATVAVEPETTAEPDPETASREIGRASCRERV